MSERHYKTYKECANALWHGNRSRKVARRIIVEADLILDTPALFASGDGKGNDDTDMVLLKASDMKASVHGKPLLTGTSLAGALRGYMQARVAGYRQKEDDKQTSVSNLFGVAKGQETGAQSLLIVEDAYGRNESIVRRDSVKIDAETGTAEDEKLFNLEAWGAGTTFAIRFELLIPKKQDEQAMLKSFYMALQGLTDGSITLGARKNRGFGRFTVSNWRVQDYDFSNRATDILNWLRHGTNTITENSLNHLDDVPLFASFKDQPVIDERKWFRMTAQFSLNGSLLVRSYGTDPGQPDSVHIRNGKDNPILPGTSVAGALRGRAERILNLLHDDPDIAKHRICCLFGDDDMRKKDAKASRLVIEEHEVTEGVTDMIQNRVAIDRFTGGAKDTALFSEQPVFGKKGTIITLGFTIRNPEPHDMGLLLLLLKDLWTSDLPLGGGSSIGRGRLSGQQASFVWKQKDKKEAQTWSVTQNEDKLIIDPLDMRQQMNDWVSEEVAQ